MAQPGRRRAGILPPSLGPELAGDQFQRGGAANRTATFDRVSNRGARNQMVSGRITVNGNTYNFRSGGHARGSLPAGDYTIRPHMWNRGDRGFTVGGVGFSFAMSDKYDSRVGGTRSALRIHPDGGSPGTAGCIGIVGDAATQRRFREDMRQELARNGGSFTLRVGQPGTPDPGPAGRADPLGSNPQYPQHGRVNPQMLERMGCGPMGSMPGMRENGMNGMNGMDDLLGGMGQMDPGRLFGMLLGMLLWAQMSRAQGQPWA